MLYYNPFLIDYLLISEDIENDFQENKTLIKSDSFMFDLAKLIGKELNDDYLSPEMYDNLDKLFSMLTEELDDKTIIERIKDKYDKSDRSGGYKFYESHFMTQFDNIEDHIQNNCFIWYKNDFDERIRSNYYIFNHIFNVENADLDLLLYSEKLLYFIKSALLKLPELFLIKSFKKKIIKLLTTNNSLIEIISDPNSQDDEQFDPIFIALFSKENNKLLEKIKNINKKNCQDQFNLKRFTNLYDESYIENCLLEKKLDIKPNELLLGKISYYIDNMKPDEFNKETKNGLANMLNIIRADLKTTESTQALNKTLIKLNSNEAPGNLYTFFRHKYADLKFSIFEWLIEQTKTLGERNDVSDIFVEDFLDGLKIDHCVLKMFICDDETFENTYIPMFTWDELYLQSFKRFYKELPSMFLNKGIYNRTITALNSIINNNKKDCPQVLKQAEKTKKMITKLYNPKR